MMQAAFVLPETTVGMVEASATRKASRPWVEAEVGGRPPPWGWPQGHHAAAGRVENGRAARVREQILVARPFGAGLDRLGDVGPEPTYRRRTGWSRPTLPSAPAAPLQPARDLDDARLLKARRR
jgi:hypothetical protein